jgi:hypothetical protein
MGGAINPLPQYAFVAWCSVKGSKGTTLPLPEPPKHEEKFQLILSLQFIISVSKQIPGPLSYLFLSKYIDFIFTQKDILFAFPAARKNLCVFVHTKNKNPNLYRDS